MMSNSNWPLDRRTALKGFLALTASGLSRSYAAVQSMQMKSMRSLTIFLIVCVSVTASAEEPATTSGEIASQPNFLFLLADDLGWGD